ncbi:hypothetical protein OCGS_1648 [Oceaniovalibus guishaninsula JLT2003]|uniref:TIGR02302 family protein n=1 Tax=Oceaniovalibus guishaninsula JLT2003 TaxID=1231392 RepID=K2HC16_9RHOB|nr:TIGR02302 family protein [Oceaniovalibus guishaninsula]EKE44132.1 hypothetical protein OCGS_1648 [Oceaniovalibus guishaninsula JLT2003]
MSRPLSDDALRGLRRPLTLTRAGMAAERAARAFWPLWALGLAVLGALMLGWHEAAPVEAVWAAALAVGAGALAAVWHGARRFRWPSDADALDRLDRSLPGRPITVLTDHQAIGGDDAASRAVWDAHVARMADRVWRARAVRPDLRLAGRDPFALRYAALLLFAVAAIWGSVLRVGTVAEMTPGRPGAALAAGPAWEGWIEPPSYTGLPSLYLADLDSRAIDVPEDSRVTLRLYGEVGALDVVETVSGGTASPVEDGAPSRDFEVVQDGVLRIEGAGGRAWDVAVIPDAPPAIAVTEPAERIEGGQFRQPFTASDDYGVTAGRVTVTLDEAAIDRRHGLAADPDPRDALVVDLPLPITGDRAAFEGALVEDFSRHPWANLPVTMTFEVTDAMGQTGASDPVRGDLAGLRFFDPVAQAVIEQRRDLLWSRDNARRVADVLRAISWQPEGVFRSHTLYLRLRVAIRRLEAGLGVTPLTPERQDEIAQALWDIAQELEHGDLADALERLRRAQDRLAEAMENGADPSEIAELMQELREAMQDYMRQLAEQSEGGESQQAQGEMQEITPDQLQQMMDRIQELMEQGRMAEAQALLEQLNRMMENMQVTQGQGQGQGQGQPGEGQQAMDDLQQTLRDQQGLSDDAFRDLQRQFGEGQQPGQQPGQQGQGRQPGQGQPGEGEGEGGGSLAERQQALRDELGRQQGNLPGAGTPEGDAARDQLGRAGEAMEGAEDALRDGDTARALDRQADAMEALREGMRQLGEAMAQDRQGAEGRAEAGDPQGRASDPLGREAGLDGRMGSDSDLLGRDEVHRRAEELLDEIRRRSGERARPEAERDYLRRLLDRF